MALTNQSCPGSRNIKQPRPEYVSCKRCGNELEIWSDEAKVTCSNCFTIYFKEQNLACVEWCSFAKECVGEEVYARVMADRPPNTDRERQIAEARERLKSYIEGKACRAGAALVAEREGKAKA